MSELVARPSIEEALSAVMGEVQAVGKGDRNKQQGYSFRGVDAVVNAVGPALRKHGVLVLPKVLSSHYREFNTAKGALMHECILEVEFTFVGPDGSTLSCSAMGESADSGDKASPKAHSVAYRTALLQALCIPTDEPDPDSQSYERAAPPQGPSEPMVTDAQRERMRELSSEIGEDRAAQVKEWCQASGIDLKHLTADDAGAVIVEMQRHAEEMPTKEGTGA